MNKAVVMKFALSAALLGTVAVGCKPASPPAALSSSTPRAERQAARLAGRASTALARQAPTKAVTFAEDAVALAPRQPAYRLLLGRAYVAAGRFVSAETALVDALALAPGDGQTQLSLALTRIALGKWDDARDLLAAAKGKVGESDRGLALSLAGDKEGGVAVLDAAARAAGADAKTRQNYALALALAGRWAEARAVAAQDLAPAQLKARMGEWAHFSQPRDAWDQVATLLHVTPVEDSGMPTALALATPAPDAAAQATDVPPSAGEVPMRVASDADEAAPAAARSTEPQPMPVAFTSPRAAPTPADAMSPVPSRGSIPPAAASTHPARAMRQVRGRYVVQLGAFSSAAKVEHAWRGVARRVDRITTLAPSRAVFETGRRGKVYRLSLAGFATRDAALDVCRRIRATQEQCFVRAIAGDALADWDAGLTRTVSG